MSPAVPMAGRWWGCWALVGRARPRCCRCSPPARPTWEQGQQPPVACNCLAAWSPTTLPTPTTARQAGWWCWQRGRSSCVS
ncbi:hypothetical protein V8C86DRAFT_2704256 [Haematococcus lacustris]